MQIRQRIFNCTEIQVMHFILDKFLKLLTYYMPFYHQSLQSYLISKKSVFLAHPVHQSCCLCIFDMQAVCCSDKQHCCPNGYTCDASTGTCSKGTESVEWNAVINMPASNVKCPDGEQVCPDGSTCCLMRNGHYGCCPFEKVLVEFLYCQLQLCTVSCSFVLSVAVLYCQLQFFHVI